MKYTTDSPEFLAVYHTLINLRPTSKTCKTLNKNNCRDCIFNSNSSICDPFVHLRDIFNKKEFEEKYPELFI